MEGFSMGRLPSGARQLLAQLPDGKSKQLAHEASMAETRSFWESLDADQVTFVARMLRRIMDAEEPDVRAGAYYGNAEMVLQMRHKRCICGEVHRDPDDLLQELTLRGKQHEAEEEALDLYNLRRVTSMSLGGDDPESVLICVGCGSVYESIEQRREAGEPGNCPGCKNDE